MSDRTIVLANFPSILLFLPIMNSKCLGTVNHCHT